MKDGFKIVSITVAILHWIFYGLEIFMIILNAETWFFGEKFNGNSAILIHFLIGFSGIFFGLFIYKKKEFAYVGGLVLFIIVLSSMQVNHFTCRIDPLCF